MVKHRLDPFSAVNKLGDVALRIGTTAFSDKALTAFAYATPFMDVTGDVIMSWMLLWRATVAAHKLEKTIPQKDAVFYQGQLKSVDFFVNAILPISMGKMETILMTSDAALEIPADAFG